MKRGRDLFAAVITAEGGLEKAIGGLKGRDLAELLDYAGGREPSDGRDEVIGLVLMVAATRYFAKARAKADKRMRRVRTIL